jgi:RND family efflux transporter MFP subunit
MKRPALTRRTLTLAGVLLPLLVLFIYVVLRSGPLAPVPVTVTTVQSRAISPALFGVGAVEARYTYRIGPTVAGRVKHVDVHVGDAVRAGQRLGEMDPVDLDDRIGAQDAALKRAQANVAAADAQVAELVARKAYAQAQLRRYEQVLQAQSVSEEAVETKRQEFSVAEASLSAAQANLDAARQELARVRAEAKGLRQQRENLRLVAPVDGLVIAREADPGTTVVAGQAVVEVIDPDGVWINARFDQLSASGLRAGLPARVALRSQTGRELVGQVLRVEPRADVVTEEILAKIVFESRPDPLPPLGELTEVTVALPALAATPVVPNASVQRVNGRLGVWVVNDAEPHFRPVTLGATDLDGHVQVIAGLNAGEQVVRYSERALDTHSRIEVVAHLPGAGP